MHRLWRRLRLSAYLILVVLAGCGASSGVAVEGQDLTGGEDVAASISDVATADSAIPGLDTDPLLNRADLELTASWVPVGEGVVEVSTAVRSLDALHASTVLRFELGEGVSFAVVPDHCEGDGSFTDCLYGHGGIDDNSAPTLPVLASYEFLVDPAVSDPSVTLTVTGFLSPEFNDPHVENNVVVLDLGGEPAVNAPIAVHDDGPVKTGDTFVVADVLANDVDLDGDLDLYSLTIVSGPEVGEVSLVDIGDRLAIEFVPDLSLKGLYDLVYRVCDSGGRCSEGQVLLSN